MSKEIEAIIEIEKDGRWFQSNYSKLRKESENKFIAIKKGKIIAESDNLENAIKTIKNKGEDPALILIEFMHAKGFELIL